MTEQERLEAIIGERFERFAERIASMERLLEERISGMSHAVSIASVEMNRRLEGMNEFRAQINASEMKYMTRQEWDSAHRMLEQQVRAIETRLDRREGETTGIRMTGSLLMTIIVAAAAFLGIVAWFMTHSPLKP